MDAVDDLEISMADCADPNEINFRMAALLKEICDLLYVTYGLPITFGMDIETAFNRVHESNMSKLVDGKPVLRPDGKVLKGPNYKPPTMEDLIQ